MSFQDVWSSSRRRLEAMTTTTTTTTTTNEDDVSLPRMRRNHPPKLPRVKAIVPPLTHQPSPKSSSINDRTTKRIHHRGRSVEQRISTNSRRNISGNKDNNNSRNRSSSVTNHKSKKQKKMLDADDMIDSYELKLSNSYYSSSSNESSSIIDDPSPYDCESRDDYESFGPDRSHHHHHQHRNQPHHSGSATKKVPQQSRFSNTATRNNTNHHHHRHQQPHQRRSTSTSTFGKLTVEMQQYQKLVSDLEYIIRDAIVTPEVAWRTNILVQSVEETDTGIRTKLEHYEQSLHEQERLLMYTNNNSTNNNNDNTSNKRSSHHHHQGDKKRNVTQQLVACSKLRRDYNRCHNSMTTSLRTYKVRQTVEISQLGAVQWNNPYNTSSSSATKSRNLVGTSSDMLQQKQSSPEFQNPQRVEEDFFDRAMRQKEIERMNDSMRQVSDIYHGLAGLVNRQQDDVDQLGDEINDSHANIRSGYDEFSCYTTTTTDRHGGFMNTFCGDMNEWGLTDDGIHGNDIVKHRSTKTMERSMSSTTTVAATTQEGLRINEHFYWSMPFETIKEDWRSVQNDFVGIGNRFVIHCKRLDCCNDE